MRPFKFRVWCEFEIDGKLHKEMAGPENWFLLTQTGHLMSHGPISFDPNAEKKYKVLIPEFFTGLCDKNGKEAYAGDNIKSYVNGRWCYDTIKETKYGWYPWVCDNDYSGIEFEIIGTVHDEEAKE